MSGNGAGIDMVAVAQMQAQIEDLRRAIQAQQETIDVLVETTADLLQTDDGDR
jgi:hypothetical protein